MRWRVYGSLVLGLALTSWGFAQAAGPPRVGDDRAVKDKQDSADDDRGRGKPRGGPMRLGDDSRRDPKKQRGYGEGRGQEINASVLDPKVLTEELKLEWQQKTEVEQIFREYEAAKADLRKGFGGGNVEQEKKRLEQDLKAARASQDRRKASEIWAELRKLRTSAADEERELQEMLIEEIEKALDDGQKVQFRRMLRPEKDRGRGVGPLDDPKVLFMCLKQVKLEDYKKTQIDRIKRDYEEQAKYRGRDVRPEEDKRIREQLLNEVKMVLNEDQWKDLERVHTKMGGPGAGGGPIDLTDPKQLQFAVMSLNTTKHRLTKEQNTDIARLRGEYMKELRQLDRKDPSARERLDERLAQDVTMLLTPEQQDAIKDMKMPAGRFGRKSRRPRGVDSTLESGDSDNRRSRSGRTRRNRAPVRDY